MSDKFDDIEGLFREGFEGFEPQVDPGVWENIASQIGAQPAAPDASSVSSGTGSSSSAIVGSTALKVAVVAITAGVISVGSYFLLKEDNVSDPVVEEVIATPMEESTEKEVIGSPLETAPEQNEQKVISAVTEESISLELKSEDHSEMETSSSVGAPAKNDQKNTLVTSSNAQPTIAEKKIEEKQIPSPVKAEAVIPAKDNATIEDERSEPEASIYASLKSGKLPLAVRFENRGSNSANNRWFVNGEEMWEKRSKMIHTFDQSGKYWVVLEISDERGARSRDSVEITVEDDVYIKIPNTFTPNGDGTNDAFVVETEGMTTLKCTIMDRTARMVYKYDSIHGHWDGRDMSGSELPEDTYFYVVEAVDSNGKVHVKKGTVTLFRSR